MRSFIAVELSEDLKQSIAQIQKQLEQYDVKLVKEKNLHFTLKFLGEIDDKQIKEVKDKLAHISSDAKPFSISLNSISAFPNINYMRVIWIGTESQDFINLHNSVSSALSDIGKPGGTPHLTIARVKSARNKKELTEFVKANENTVFGKMLVDKISLKKSTLTPNGPIYENIEVFML